MNSGEVNLAHKRGWAAERDDAYYRTLVISRKTEHIANTRIIAFAIVALAIFSSVVVYLIDDGRPAIACAIIVIAAPAAISVRRFRDHGLLDPLGLYCFAFASYNGVILLRLATMEDQTATPYPWTFSQETYGQVGYLLVIAAIAIYVTGILVPHIVPKTLSRLKASAVIPSRSGAWLPAGIAIYCAGLTMYFLQYGQIGGYLAGLKAGRGSRFEQFQSAGLSWPYMAFVLPGLAAIWYAACQNPSKGKRVIAWTALLLWCALLIPQGDRLLPIQAVITVTSVWTICRRRTLKPTLRLFVLLGIAYVALAAFGYLRVVIAPLVSGEMTQADAGYVVQNDSILDNIKPERSELAGPFLSILQITASPSGYFYQGNSYIEASVSILPKALYPGIKPMYLSERFAQSIHMGTGAASGWGFNPVAEAYLNFGAIGVAPMFVAWVLVFYLLSTLKGKGPVGALILSVLLTEAIDANRMDCRNTYCTVVYFTVGVFLTYLIATSLDSLGDRLSPLYGAAWKRRLQTVPSRS